MKNNSISENLSLSFLNSLVLFAYIEIINFIGIERNLTYFLIWNTIYILYLRFIKKVDYNGPGEVLFCFFSNLVLHLCVDRVLMNGLLNSNNYTLIIPAFIVLLLIAEFFNFKLFETDKKEKFEVKLSKNWSDYTLVPAVLILLWIPSSLGNMDKQIKSHYSSKKKKNYN